jgi:class 3 adenylate cyclase
MAGPGDSIVSARRGGGLARLAARDVLLVLTLVPIWAVAFGLHLKQVVSGRLAWVPVFVAAPESATAYPVVTAFWAGGDAHPGGLEIGDRLLRVGSTDLVGMGPIRFIAHAFAAAGPDLSVPVLSERAGAQRALHIQLARVSHAGSIAPFVAILAVTAIVVLIRVPRAPVGRAFFLGAISYATHWSLFGGGPPLQTYLWAAVFFTSSLVMFPLLLRPALLFPDDTAPRSGSLPWWPWIFAVFGPLAMSWMFGTPLAHAIGQRGSYLINVVFAGTYLGLLTRNYRRAGAIGRRQLKWVIYGLYVGLVPMFAVDLITAVHPPWWWLHEIAPIALIPVPICLLIAIGGYHLFDIDRLISITAVYTALSILLVAALVIVVPRVATAASTTFGIDPATGQLVFSLVFAAALVPAQRYFRPRLERLVFRERHELRAGFDRLLAALSTCTTPRELLTLAGERLDALVRPEVCRIYGATDEGYVLTFAREAQATRAPAAQVLPRRAMHGTSAPAPPRRAARVRLPSLRALRKPLDVARGAAAPDANFSAASHAMLESLGLAVVVPVTYGEEALTRDKDPVALVCLGPKRSGDVYTPTDLALLRALADKLSGELQRFDAAEVLRQERTMQQALRRYVPDPVVGLLANGEDIAGGEREVSILFVDLRGFTSYSERHDSGSVVSIVSRYTEAVSGIIRDHGGTVVEFLGDGLMAVFGAPAVLPDHAAAAVRCAITIVVGMRDLRLAGPDEAPIEVGIGLATGTAFVGDVRSADRLFYTAIGDVVNLAARLEKLTRTLGAAIAIDDATYAAAGAAAADFEAHGPTLIRGRQQAVDVYFIPLAPAPSEQPAA